LCLCIPADLGELHLERCMKDLRERFAKITIEHSAPIVPFRETIVQKLPSEIKSDEPDSITITTPDKRAKLTMRAVPLPEEIVKFIEGNNKPGGPIRALLEIESEDNDNDNDPQEIQKSEKSKEKDEKIIDFLKRLREMFENNGQKWKAVFNKIVAFGPKRIGANILINNTQHLKIPQIWKSYGSKIFENNNKNEENGNENEEEGMYISSILNGFQLGCLSGPLCEEPLIGIAFFLENLEIDTEETEGKAIGTTSRQLISTTKEACRQTFSCGSPRLSLAIYSCDIHAYADVLGKVYGVLSKRKGKILSEEMKEGTSIFIIKATLPVVESFGFSEEIRTKTSGLASPQLVFCGWEIFDENPFWVPTTEEELEDLGEKADRENIALRYMNNVRKRKGLPVQEKIVENPEKQSNMKK